jgi:signal peptidase I
MEPTLAIGQHVLANRVGASSHQRRFGTFPGTIRIPSGEYFKMGDNRGESDDSRFWGPIRARWIIGRVFFTYSPPDRIGFM